MHLFPAPTSRADALSWILIGSLALGCLLLGHVMGFGVLIVRALLSGLGVAALLAGLAIGHARSDARLVAGATAFLQMTLFTILAVVLTYLLASQAGPLWDLRLAAADRRLGFDWPAVLALADRLPAPLLAIGGLAYYSLIAQMVLCIVVLAASWRLARLRVMVAAAILAGVTTVLVSGAMPAVGNLFDPDRYTVLWPSVAWVERALVLGLRDGSVRDIDLLHMSGIVSFPSYHATLPVILVWGLYPIRWLRLPAMTWAGLTIAATPLFGGHYVVDVLGGVLLALVALAIATRLALRAPASDGVLRPCNHGIGALPIAAAPHGGSKDSRTER